MAETESLLSTCCIWKHLEILIIMFTAKFCLAFVKKVPISK